MLAGHRTIELGSGPGSPAQVDWLHDSAGFIEQLTAWLWSTHQTEHFREVADAFVEACAAANPAPLGSPRLGIVVLGQGAPVPSGARFERLLPFGVHLTQVDPEGGLDSLLAAVALRARPGTSSTGSPQPFAHWSTDGDHSAATAIPNLTQVAYGAVAPARKQLLARTDQAIASGSMGRRVCDLCLRTFARPILVCQTPRQPAP